jgi:hypothetical protein
VSRSFNLLRKISLESSSQDFWANKTQYREMKAVDIGE